MFPPPGWDHTHVARGTALPDITLELDHVHGCGPGLVDQTSPVPIFCVPARVPAKPPKRGEEMDERARMLELKLKEEAVFFAAGVGIVQTMRADGRDPADVAREEAERDAAARSAAKHPWDPPPAAPRRRDPDQPQRHFRGHADDVRCVTIHETTRHAASGEMGVCPAAMVWSIDAKSGQPPLAVLRHPRRSRRHLRGVRHLRGEARDGVRRRRSHGDALGVERGGLRVTRRGWSARRADAVERSELPDDAPRRARDSLHPESRRPRPLRDVRDHARAILASRGASSRLRRRRGVRGAAAAAIRDRGEPAGKSVGVEGVCSVFLDWSVAKEGSSAWRQRVAPAPEDDARSIDPAEESNAVNFISESPRGGVLFWKSGGGTVSGGRRPG